MQNEKCFNCGEETLRPVILENYKTKVPDEYGRNKEHCVEITVPYFRCNKCSSCNEIAIGHDGFVDIEEARCISFGIMTRAMLEYRRIHLGLTQMKLAHLCNMTVDLINNLETDRTYHNKILDNRLTTVFEEVEKRIGDMEPIEGIFMTQAYDPELYKSYVEK